MGEVYRARDRRLGREVALKVLPAELSADVDRLARFEQEARSASALNHPNIVTIHEIGRHDETSYISMELVDGKTVRELMAAGPVPIRKLLGIAAQVADGLAKAHAAGIVHRDLKPENVMVSRDGFVKVLDFGLAKLVEPESGSELSAMPTLARAQTHPGVVMGTVAYMSPEQASGEPVDSAPTSSRSARSFTRPWAERNRSRGRRPPRPCRRSSGRTRSRSARFDPRSPFRCGGSSSAVSRRTPRSATPRRAISLATSPGCGTTSRKRRRARPPRSNKPRGGKRGRYRSPRPPEYFSWGRSEAGSPRGGRSRRTPPRPFAGSRSEPAFSTTPASRRTARPWSTAQPGRENDRCFTRCDRRARNRGPSMCPPTSWPFLRRARWRSFSTTSGSAEPSPGCPSREESPGRPSKT